MRNAVLMAALGSATAGGVFFAFSSFVMHGLSRLPQAQGMAAMQSINVAAVRPAFMAVLFGTTVICAGILVRASTSWDERYSIGLIIAALLYLIGTMGLTIVYHVPRNEALAALDPSNAATLGQWTDYAAAWTRWNHLRTVSSLAACVVFMHSIRP